MTSEPATPPADAGARESRRRTGACSTLSLIVAILIAGVLQFAAAAKLAHGADVVRRMKDAAVMAEHGLSTDFNPADYQWLVAPDASLHAGVPIEFPISAGEFLLVVLVLAGHRSRWVWLIVPLVFATFFGYALQRMLSGLPCGCFGDLWRPPDGVSMTFDAGFTILGLLIAGIRRTRPGVLAATTILALAGCAAGYVYAAQTNGPGAVPGASARPSPDDANPPANPGPNSTTTQGAGSADSETPPPPDLSTPPTEKLLASSLMAKPLAAQKDNGEPLAYYVFIWDPTCSTCERLKPVVEDYKKQYQEEQNPFLQVLLFKKQDLRDQLGIQPYEWDSSPYVFVVRDGEVTTLPGGDDAVLPDEVLTKLSNDEPLDEGTHHH